MDGVALSSSLWELQIRQIPICAHSRNLQLCIQRKKNKNMQDNQDFSFRLHELKDRRKSRRQEDMLSVGINTVIRFLAERKMKILIPLCAMRMKLGPCDQ